MCYLRNRLKFVPINNRSPKGNNNIIIMMCIKKLIMLMLSLPVSLPRLCEQYDSISTKVYEDPQTTDEMVQLVSYLTTVRYLIPNYNYFCMNDTNFQLPKKFANNVCNALAIHVCM